jgi:hypothetical protein
MSEIRGLISESRKEKRERRLRSEIRGLRTKVKDQGNRKKSGMKRKR